MTHARSLATAQTVPLAGDVAANVGEHVRLARAAADEGARFVVFPELSLTGYELELAAELAFDEGDARLAPLARAAAAWSVTLVAGAPVRLGERLCIGAFVLAPDRSVALYTKRHLGAFSADADPGGCVPPPESSVFAPGERDPLVRAGGDVAALAICADTGRAAHAEHAAARGATAYLASAFVIPADYANDAARLAGYAQRHTLAVVLANFGGPSGGLASAGRSAVWSPAGALVAQLRPSGAGLAIACESGGRWRGRTVALDGG